MDIKYMCSMLSSWLAGCNVLPIILQELRHGSRIMVQEFTKISINKKRSTLLLKV